MRPGCGPRRGTDSSNVPPLGAFCLPVLLALLVWLAAAPVTAHEGHDLETPGSPGASRAVPRLVADSESYELVAVLEGQRLIIYLDRFEDNSPVTDANMTVTINEEPVVAQVTGNGTYSVVSNLFEHGGLFEFVFDIKAPEGADLGLEYDANYTFNKILPVTGDYLIIVDRPTTSKGTANYKMVITIR